MKKFITLISFLFLIGSVGAQVKISDLNLKSTIGGTEKIPVGGPGNPAINSDLLKAYIIRDVPTAIGTNNKTASFTQAVSSYVVGDRFTIFNQTANTGSVTLNFNANGSRPVVKDGGSPLVANDMKASAPYTFVYDGTSFHLIGSSGGGVSATTLAGYGITDGVNTSTTVNGHALSSNVTVTATDLTGILPVANGGTGTATPGIVAGTNITVTGTWPNQTVNSSGGGGGMSNPMTTAADLIVGGSSGTPARLAVGAALQQIRVNAGGTAIEYFTPTPNPMLGIGDMLQGDVSGTPVNLPSVAANNVLLSGGIGSPVSWGKVNVASGGTGVTSATAYAPIFGGTTSTGAFQSGTVGTSGQVLTSNGAGVLPTFQTLASSGSWALASGGTLTGANTITGIENGLTYANTWTATANNAFAISKSGTITSRNTASDVLTYETETPTLSVNAGAPASQVLISRLHNPTFTGTGTYVLERHTSSINGTLRFDIRNTNNGASASSLIQLGNDASATATSIFVNSSGAATPNAMNIYQAQNASMVFTTNNSARYTISGAGAHSFNNTTSGSANNFLTFTQAANTTTGGALAIFTAGAHTTMAASTEITDINFNLSATEQHSTGAITLQRDSRIQGRTHSFVGASTITDMFAHAVIPSRVGANGTATRGGGILVETVNVINGGTAVPDGYGILSNAPTGATRNWAAGFVGDVVFPNVGDGLFLKEGTNAISGIATLSGGTVTVNTTSVTANSRIVLTIQSLGTVAVPTTVGVTARSAGTSFTITSASGTDTSVIYWMIIEPAP